MNCTWGVETDADGQWQKLFLVVVAFDAANQIVPPRTKKNSGVNRSAVNGLTGRSFVMRLPSVAYSRWESAATKSMILCMLEMRRGRLMDITDYVNVAAKIYRDRDIGDTNGFTQAVGDWLEHCGILANDKQIESWNGTERLKDAECPRVELCLTYLHPAPAKKAKKSQ